ncbi:hypothetical protein ACN24M_00275 [Streptomyces microflavus]
MAAAWGRRGLEAGFQEVRVFQEVGDDGVVLAPLVEFLAPLFEERWVLEGGGCFVERQEPGVVGGGGGDGRRVQVAGGCFGCFLGGVDGVGQAFGDAAEFGDALVEGGGGAACGGQGVGEGGLLLGQGFGACLAFGHTGLSCLALLGAGVVFCAQAGQGFLG